MGKYPSIIITFFITIIGWVLFRSESFHQIGYYLQAMFAFDFGEIANYGSQFWLILVLAVFFSFSTLSKWGQSMEQLLFFPNNYPLKGYLSMSLVYLVLLALSLASITSSGFNPFIYFRF